MKKQRKVFLSVKGRNIEHRLERRNGLIDWKRSQRGRVVHTMREYCFNIVGWSGKSRFKMKNIIMKNNISTSKDPWVASSYSLKAFWSTG
jgi:hypothetical protein